jgi:hypothetical protein
MPPVVPVAKESVSDERRPEDRFGIGRLSRVTDADAPVGPNEHVPRVYLEAEDAVAARAYVVTVEQRVESVRVNVIEQRWEIDRINVDGFR